MGLGQKGPLIKTDSHRLRGGMAGQSHRFVPLGGHAVSSAPSVFGAVSEAGGELWTRVVVESGGKGKPSTSGAFCPGMSGL